MTAAFTECASAALTVVSSLALGLIVWGWTYSPTAERLSRGRLHADETTALKLLKVRTGLILTMLVLEFVVYGWVSGARLLAVFFMGICGQGLVDTWRRQHGERQHDNGN